MIAMALATDPELLIADEPTTALDVTIQAQILDLMRELRARSNTAIIFITHDLGVVAEMAENVAVMYAGQIVESADVRTIFAAPRMPYTQGPAGVDPGARAGPGGARGHPGHRAQPDRPAARAAGSRRAARTRVRARTGHLHASSSRSCCRSRRDTSVRCWLYHDHPRAPGAAATVGRGESAGSAVTGDGARLGEPARTSGAAGAASDAGTRSRTGLRGRRDHPARSRRRRARRAPARAARTARSSQVRDLVKHFPVRSGVLQRVAAWVQAVDGVTLRHPPRRDVRPRRRVRVRQDDRRADHPAPDRAHQRQVHLRRARRVRAVAPRAEGAAQGHADHLPGPVLEPRSAHADRREHRRGAVRSRHARARERRSTGAPGARRGRPATRARAALSARVLRRAAPAHRHRPGPGLRPKLIVCDEPVSALDVSIQSQVLNLLNDLQQRVRPDLPVHRPQPGRGRAHLRPGRRDVPGQDRRAGRQAGALRASAATPTPRRWSAPSRSPTRRCSASASSCRAMSRARSNPPPGCVFHPRCPIADRAVRARSSRCSAMSPRGEHEHWVACHLVV